MRQKTINLLKSKEELAGIIKGVNDNNDALIVKSIVNKENVLVEIPFPKIGIHLAKEFSHLKGSINYRVESIEGDKVIGTRVGVEKKPIKEVIDSVGTEITPYQYDSLMNRKSDKNTRNPLSIAVTGIVVDTEDDVEYTRNMSVNKVRSESALRNALAIMEINDPDIGHFQAALPVAQYVSNGSKVNIGKNLIGEKLTVNISYLAPYGDKTIVFVTRDRVDTAVNKSFFKNGNQNGKLNTQTVFTGIVEEKRQKSFLVRYGNYEVFVYKGSYDEFDKVKVGDKISYTLQERNVKGTFFARIFVASSRVEAELNEAAATNKVLMATIKNPERSIAGGVFISLSADRYQSSLSIKLDERSTRLGLGTLTKKPYIKVKLRKTGNKQHPYIASIVL